MKRKIAYGLIGVAGMLLVAALAWGMAWLSGTAQGARWLIDALSRSTPLTISARTVEGRLLDRLVLGDVRLVMAPYDVTIQRLDWQWVPRHLLSGRITTEALTLEGVEIRDSSADRPPDLSWPRISPAAGLFDARIERLLVKGLTYRLRDEEPLLLTLLSSRLDWRRGGLFFTALSASSPEGSATGEIGAGFETPFLRFDLAVTPAGAVAGLDGFGLTGKFHAGKGGEQLAGEFALSGSSGKTKEIALAGEAGMTPKALLLRNLRLTRPGRRGEATGAGSVTPTAGAPLFEFTLSASGIDLAPETGQPTDLSGTLTFTGTPKAYQGMVSMANRGKGWRAAHLAGSYRGDGEGVTISGLSGGLVGGTLRGGMTLDWQSGISLSAALRARELNPAMVDPGWEGVVNFDLVGEVAWQGQAPPRGKVNGRFLESRLHGRTLTGEVVADFAGSELSIGRLVLNGRGFDIRATGNLGRRLDFTARVDDLGRLVPQTAGEFGAEGWVRVSGGRPSGALTGKGRNLAAGGIGIASLNLTARLGEGKGYPVNAAATLRGVTYGGVRVDSAALDGQGVLLDHRVHALLRHGEAELSIDLSGGFDRQAWEGKILRLSGRDTVGPFRLEAPAPLSISAGRMALSSLVLTGDRGERFEMAGDLTLSPAGEPSAGTARVLFDGLNLTRVNPWLPRDLRLEGRLAGSATGRLLAGGRAEFGGTLSLGRGKIRWQKGRDGVDADLQSMALTLGWTGRVNPPEGQSPTERLSGEGRIVAAAAVTLDGNPVTLEKGDVAFSAGEPGLKISLDAALAGGGKVKGSFSSPVSPLTAFPQTGDVKAEWSGIDPALLGPWLPRELVLSGRIQGRTAGNLLAGKAFALRGEASLSGGMAGWIRPEGEMNVRLQSASATWEWQGEALTGEAALTLAERGQARGSFRLPIPARLPMAFDRKGALALTLSGQINEDGLLSSLFPGLVRESNGKIDGTLKVGGTWDDPKIEGSATLAGAGAYLPTAGIRIRGVKLAMRLEKDLIRIDSFRAESGPGHIEGSALVRLAGWQVADYQGRIDGERFQAVFLPELQILASPRLTFEGTKDLLALRGEVQLPEMFILGAPSRDVVLASPDVVIEGAVKPVAKTFSMPLDVRVRLVIGQRVLVKLEGIDAKLAGAIDLEFRSLDRITSRGEIRVEKGRYRAYGVDLEIVRGRLFYAGGPLNQPTLDMLALRSSGDVKAGVTAGGILRAPTVKLYSEPSMPDADILSYILFGHPMSNSSNREQAGMMAQAASVLLSKGQSVALQEQIKKRLGLSTLEIQSESADAAEKAGYKAIQAAPAGVAAAGQTNGLAQTMVTVGKYLTPQLYFSYGRSLFTGGNLFRLRYDIFKQWQIETQTGSESGVDLYYRIDFQ